MSGQHLKIWGIHIQIWISWKIRRPRATLVDIPLWSFLTACFIQGMWYPIGHRPHHTSLPRLRYLFGSFRRLSVKCWAFMETSITGSFTKLMIMKIHVE